MSEATAEHPVEDPHAEHEHAHPNDGSYVWVAVFLGVVTAAEVGTYYVPGLAENTGLLLAVLLPMMVVKFAVVVMWFMHLKFDSRLFSRVFVAGLVLAVTVYMITLATFGFF